MDIILPLDKAANYFKENDLNNYFIRSDGDKIILREKSPFFKSWFGRLIRQIFGIYSEFNNRAFRKATMQVLRYLEKNPIDNANRLFNQYRPENLSILKKRVTLHREITNEIDRVRDSWTRKEQKDIRSQTPPPPPPPPPQTPTLSLSQSDEGTVEEPFAVPIHESTPHNAQTPPQASTSNKPLGRPEKTELSKDEAKQLEIMASELAIKQLTTDLQDFAKDLAELVEVDGDQFVLDSKGMMTFRDKSLSVAERLKLLIQKSGQPKHELKKIPFTYRDMILNKYNGSLPSDYLQLAD